MFISYLAENPCQQDQNGCEHICYQSDGEDKCSCRVGYKLNEDGKTCSGIFISNFIGNLYRVTD